MRRTLVVLLAAVLGSVIGSAVLVGAGAGWAQQEGDPGEGLETTIRHDGEPVADVTISVYAEDGTPVASGETDRDGYWSVSVPESATYRVELDESTLPAGLTVVNGTVREPFVRPGTVGPVLFALTAGATSPADPATPSDPSPGSDRGNGEPGAVPDDPEGEVEVVSGSGSWGRVVASVYDGIHFGLLIALAALGLSLVFGTMGLINFAHGELVTFGAFAALALNVAGVGLFGLDLALHLVIATPLAVALGVGFGYVQDRYFWGWLRRRGTGLVTMMIISIGLALVLRHLYLYAFGPERNNYAQYAIQEPERIGPLVVPVKTLVTDAIALAVLVGVASALVLTRFGKAVRAVADNPSLAAASGINVDRIIRLVWATGTGLAALAGVFLAMHQSAIYLMGFQMLLLIFAAVIVGGLGTAFGAMVGGLIVGLLVQVSTLWVPSEFKYVVALVVLIAVLLLRPQGVLGRRLRVG